MRVYELQNSINILKIIYKLYILGCTLAQRGNGGGPRRKQEEVKVKEVKKEVINDDETDQCPEPNGHFADAGQCDKYYSCTEVTPYKPNFIHKFIINFNLIILGQYRRKTLS